MLFTPRKRIALFAGHYGSGKSTAAMGYAGLLRGLYPQDTVALADLDIVNPYFRTSDCAQTLQHMGVQLIASEYAGSNVDVPAMPGGAYRITEDKTLRVIIDVGGDDRGALAMGRYAPAILEENNYDMLAVVNCYRPLTRTAADTVGVLREIEAACGIPFTGIANCSSMGRETTSQTVLSSAGYADEISAAMRIPVLFTSVREDLVPEMPEGMPVVPVKHIISHGGIENY